jgi:predicted O-methyltransferase YrrM
MKKMLVKVFNKLVAPMNIKLVKACRTTYTDFSDHFVKDKPDNKIVHLNKMSYLSENIAGMIDSRAGEELFSLAYMQALKGNVVEVGSFQGKSTFFLGNAVKMSGNGKMYAIDHFKGNKGKEQFYVVSKDDLSDLESGFRENMKKAYLSEVVTLINKPNVEAAKEIEDKSIRFLFIDGDHTADGVRRDLSLFKNKLKDGAIIAFDDYDNVSFGGLVKVVNEFIAKGKIKKKYLLGRTLIVELDS